MLTIKELSEELHLSKTAINNRINELGLKDGLVKDGNKHLVPDNIADEIRQSFLEKRKTESASDKTADVIEILSEQLREKDRQIESLMRQLEQLQSQNGSLLQAVQQGNYLLASSLGVADPAEKASAGDEKDEPIKEPASEKIGFFARLFRK